jgi:DNA repair exonuclease SbcCD nuclease subunit
MKLVLFGDLHLDTPFAWIGQVSKEAARKRRQALRDVLMRIIHLTEEVKADALLCSGDLFEQERITPDTAAFLQKTFESVAPLPVYIAPGNHDYFGPRSPYAHIRWSSNVHIFKEARLTPVCLQSGVTLWGGAHCVPANADDFLAGFRTGERQGVHLALFHGSELGWFDRDGESKRPYAPFRAEEIPAAGLHHAFLGHIHTPRDAERHTYPGNPDPLGFGEIGERGAVVITIRADGTVSRERRVVALSQVHELTVQVDGCASQQEVRERLTAALAGLSGCVRVTLAGQLRVEVDLQPRDLCSPVPGIDALVIRPANLCVAYDFESLRKETTVRGQFVDDVLRAELPEQERRAVLVTGLRALESRSDLDVV